MGALKLSRNRAKNFSKRFLKRLVITTKILSVVGIGAIVWDWRKRKDIEKAKEMGIFKENDESRIASYLKQRRFGKPVVSIFRGLGYAMKRAVLYVALSVCLFGGIGSGIYFRMDQVRDKVLEEQQNLPQEEGDLAILVSSKTFRWYERLVEPVAIGFLDLYYARLELAFGTKAKTKIFGATKQDFLDALTDPEINNIVIYGHGSNFTWLASDGSLTSAEVQYIATPKNGFLIRHTCENQVTVQTKILKNLRNDKQIEFFNVVNRASGKLRGTGITMLTAGFNNSEIRRTNYKNPGLGWYVYVRFKDEEGKEHTGRFGSGLAKIHDFVDLVGKKLGKDAERKLLLFIIEVQKYVRANSVRINSETIKFGETAFEEDNIVVATSDNLLADILRHMVGEDRVNYPWDWIRYPFGKERQDVDKFRFE